MIRFFVPGEPVAKGRARSFVRNGRISHVTPEKTANYESLVRLAAHRAMGAADVPLLTGPLALSFHACFAIPKSWSNKRMAANAVHAESVIKRPDLDNLLKSLSDGMNGVVYGDDAQVVRLEACTKVYGDVPGVMVEVWEVER